MLWFVCGMQQVSSIFPFVLQSPSPILSMELSTKRVGGPVSLLSPDLYVHLWQRKWPNKIKPLKKKSQWQHLQNLLS